MPTTRRSARKASKEPTVDSTLKAEEVPASSSSLALNLPSDEANAGITLNSDAIVDESRNVSTAHDEKELAAESGYEIQEGAQKPLKTENEASKSPEIRVSMTEKHDGDLSPPIGGVASNLDSSMTEHPPETKEEEVEDSRPFPERFEDKNWRVRSNAYIAAKALLEADPRPTAEWYQLLATSTARVALDSSPAALDVGLGMLQAFVSSVPAEAVADVISASKATITAIVDKSLSARREIAVKGQSVLLALMSVAREGSAEAGIRQLLTRLSDKKPKIPPACMETILKALRTLGSTLLSSSVCDEVIACLPIALDSPNSQMREQAMAVLVHIAKSIGLDSVRVPVLDRLRSAQQAEFTKLLDAEGCATAVTASEEKVDAVDASEVKIQTAGEKETEGGIATAIDAEVDLSGKLKNSEFATLVNDPKWSNQLAGMQCVLDLLQSASRIKPGTDISNVLSTCKTFLRQGHVAVQVATLKVIGLLAKCLKSEFSSSVKPLLQSIVSKCKEKKLVTEVQQTLEAIITHCVLLDVMSEDICEHVANKKNAAVGRVGLLEMLLSVLASPQRIGDAALKDVAAAVAIGSDDADPSVREKSAQVLSEILKTALGRGSDGSPAVQVIHNLETSNNRLFKKLTGKTHQEAEETEATVALPKKQSPKKKSPIKSSPAGKAKASLPTEPAAATAADDKDEVMDLEAAIASLCSLEIPGWETELQALMESPKWDEKVQGLSTLAEAFSSKSSLGGQLSVPVTAYLYRMTNGFKVSNINVNRALMRAFTAAASHCGEQEWSKTAAARVVGAFADKLGDKKLNEDAELLLMALSEATTPGFIHSRVLRCADGGNKPPLLLQGLLTWSVKLLNEFGMIPSPASMAKAAETHLENRSAPVRAAALALLGTMHEKMGPAVRALLGNLSTSVQASVDAEFARVGYDPASSKAPSRKTRGNDADSGASERSRSDLLALLPKGILMDLSRVEGKDSWKVRRNAIEAVQSACIKTGYSIEYSKPLTELLRALKARVTDTQANLKPQAANAIGVIMASLEAKQAVKVLPIVSPALLLSSGDNKKSMREASINALNCIVCSVPDPAQATSAGEQSLVNALLPGITDALSNTVGRMDLLKWLQQHSGSISKALGAKETVELGTALVLALQDKQAPVRATAEAVLLPLAQQGSITASALEKATRDMSAATRRPIQASLDRAMAVASNGPTNNDTSLNVSQDEVVPVPAGPRLGAPSRNATAPSIPTVLKEKASEKTKESTVSSLGAPVRALTSKAAKVSAESSVASVPEVKVEATVTDDESRFKLRKCSKTARLEDKKFLWPSGCDDVTETELSVLQAVWEPLIQSSSFAEKLFRVPRDGPGILFNQDSLIPALDEISVQITGPHFWSGHVDLTLRYLTWALCVRETFAGTQKVLKVMQEVLQFAADNNKPLHDVEAGIFLPHVLERSGHKTEKHRLAFKTILEMARSCCSPKAQISYLIPALSCKNKRSRVIALEEILALTITHGFSILGRSGCKELGNLLDAKDSDVSIRNACIEICMQSLSSSDLNGDMNKLIKLLGEPSERARNLILARNKARTAKAGVSEVTITPPKKNKKVTPTKAATAAAAAGGGAVDSTADAPFVLEMTPPDTEKARRRMEKFDTKEIDAKMAELSAVMSHLNATMSPRSPRAARTYPPSGAKPVKFVFDSPTNDRVDGESLSPNVTSRSPKKKKKITGVDSGSPAEQILSSTGSRSSEKKKKTSPKLKGKSPHASPSAVTTENGGLSEIFAEISTKLDNFLADRNFSSATSVDATDYIKILHSIASGDWCTEVLPADDVALVMHSKPLLDKLLRCVDRAFASDAPVAAPSNSPGADLAMRGVDVSMASAALATVFSLLKKPGAESLGSLACADIVSTCLVLLVDSRITQTMTNVTKSGVKKPALAPAEDETAVQIVRALNVISLKAAAAMPPVHALRAAVTLLTRCIKGDVPAIATKPCSKLIQRVLAEETALPPTGVSGLPGPFQSSPKDSAALLLALHNLLNSLGDMKEMSAAQETSLSCAKSILKEMVVALGRKRVLRALEAEGAIETSVSVKLVLKLSVPNDSDSGAQSRANETAPSPLLKKAIALADEVAAARDKAQALRALWETCQMNPSLEVASCIQHLGSHHRRYITDHLATLTATETMLGESDENVPVTGTFSNSLGSTSSGGSKGKRRSKGSAEKKKKAPTDGSPAKKESTALHPRSSSIDNLPAPPAATGGVTKKNSSPDSRTVSMPPVAPETASNGIDSDLMARFQRLKQQAGA